MNKNILAILVVLGVILVGVYFITNKQKNTALPIIPDVTGPITHYSCRDGSIDAIFGQSSMTMTLSDGRKISLPQVISGSGIRYEQGEFVFIGKGDNAFLQEKGMTTYEDCVANASDVNATAGETTFVDQGKTISFSYPNAFALSGGELGYTPTWRINTQTLGIVIAKVTIPKTTQPQTNLSDSTFTIGTSSDKNAIKNCLIPTNGEISKGKETINGIPYSKIVLSDAGAGNFYDTTSYRTIQNKQCYAVEYTIHSTNFASYDPNLGISEFDTQKVVTALETMVNSVNFLSQEPTENTTSVTPLEIIEDSRCPQGVQCVWAGTVKLKVNVTNKSGVSTQDTLTLGEPKTIAGVVVTLTSVMPTKTTKTLKLSDYTFKFSTK
jgi:membrane-bound inhibitor of C-type lysozyme